MREFIFAVQLLGLLQLGKTQTSCTPDVAVPIDDTSTSTSGTSSSSGFGTDPGAAAIASAQVAGASAIADLTGTDLDGGDGGFGGPADLIDVGPDPTLARLLRKRASLDCTSSESCYSLQGSPLCVDDQTYDFHLGDGTTGNLQTGDYTLPDGQDGNFNTGPYPTLAAGASTTFDASATIATRTNDASTITRAQESTDAIPTAADSTLANTKDIPTEGSSSIVAAETGASSSTRTPRTSSSATQPATSARPSGQAFKGAATSQGLNSNYPLMLLAALGLRAML